MFKKLIPTLMLIAVLGLASRSAKADDIHLCDNTTACSNGAMTLTTSSNLYLFGKVTTDDDVYVAGLAPTTGTGADTFTSTNGFYTVVSSLLGVTLSSTPSQPKFSDFDSNFTGAGGSASATGFNVTLYNLGMLSLSETTATAVNATIPAGDAVLAFTFNPTTDSVDSVSPNSSDFLLGKTVSTPEPSSILLLALGLSALCLFKHRSAALTH
jgi:hypothetical protein